MRFLIDSNQVAKALLCAVAPAVSLWPPAGICLRAHNTQ